MTGYRVDRLWPDPASDLALDEAFAELHLPDPPADRAWLAVNMVTSIDGRATLHGAADGLGSRADRRLMRLLRAGHDAVASGAGTLRRADFFSRLPDDLTARRAARGEPPQPTAVLIGGEGAIPPDRRWFRGDQPRLVILGGEAAEPNVAGAEVLRSPTPRPEPAWLLRELRRRGIRSVLLEGGPTVNAAFLGAGLIDELFWTVGARLVGNDGLPMITAIPGAVEPRDGRLVSVHRHADELWLRYRFASIGS